jgi:hypothetical protein
MRRFLKPLILITFSILVFVLVSCASSSSISPAMPSIAPAPPATGQAGIIDKSYTNSYGGAGESAASEYNGYVVSSNQRADEENPTGYISVRVPADKYDSALQKLRILAVKVLYETTNSQDVTEQYMDLKAQLGNLEATEAQYLELLKKAESVTDILEVQKELSNVRGQIEQLKGRIQYLERTSDMSIIEINLLKSKPIGAGAWDVPGIFKSAIDGLVVFGKVLLGILIWVVVFIPLWIIIIVIVVVVRRRKRKVKLEASK